MTSPGWRPQLVALDIDGTLVDANNAMPQPIYDAVRRVLAAGVPVVLATGRSWVATKPVATHLELPHGMHVCSNGAVTLSYPPLEVLHEITFSPAEVIDVVTQRPSVQVAAEQIDLGFRVTENFAPGQLAGELIVDTVPGLKERDVARLVLRDPEATDAYLQEVANELGLNGVSYYVGPTHWLDIIAGGVDKATGMEFVCENLGIDPADVLAMGDGLNDIELLAWAGRGVAIGDALPQVQAVADAVTGRFVDMGTVEELSRWFD